MNNRVALFLMGYRGRRRLKIVGHARIKDVPEVDGETLQHMGVLPPRTKVERIIFVDELVASLRGQISQLENDLQSLRDRRLESTSS